MKNWLLEVGLKTFGPSAVRGAILGIGTFLAAKAGMLSAFGVAYDSVTHILTVNLDHLQLGVVAIIPAIGAGLIKATQTTAVNAVKPKEETPQ